VYCTGSNSEGILGLGHNIPTNGKLMRYMSYTTKILPSSSTDYHLCLLPTRMALYLVGDKNDYGQLGRKPGEFDQYYKPHQVNFNEHSDINYRDMRYICWRVRYSLMRMKNGDVYAWGSNKFGQLGLREWSMVRSYPVQFKLKFNNNEYN